tara:strand:- start:8104 stop:8682 length:579 start_codon:yes stop_codon:yes gene_type:complete
MTSQIVYPPYTLAIGIGANLPSAFGSPISTLVAVRPKVENEICLWIQSSLTAKISYKTIHKDLRWRWSDLFETDPIGGPENQPNYINTALLVDGEPLRNIFPTHHGAEDLLQNFLKLEKEFGRDRESSTSRWMPRTLDIDLLSWGSLQINSKLLTLPHPRMTERSFVITPLADALNKGEKPPKKIETKIPWE